MDAGNVIVVMASAGIFQSFRQQLYACDCDLDCAEVVMGGTHKTCGTNGLSGTRVLRVRVARLSTSPSSAGDDAACFPNICLNDVAPTRAPAQRIRERGGGLQAALPAVAPRFPFKVSLVPPGLRRPQPKCLRPLELGSSVCLGSKITSLLRWRSTTLSLVLGGLVLLSAILVHSLVFIARSCWKLHT